MYNHEDARIYIDGRMIEPIDNKNPCEQCGSRVWFRFPDEDSKICPSCEELNYLRQISNQLSKE